MKNLLYIGTNIEIMANSDFWKKKFDEWYLERKSEFESFEEVWAQQSKIFRNFWDKKILDVNYNISNGEIEDIIRLLDNKAKGNVGANAVASLYVRQNVQMDLLKTIKSDPERIKLLNKFFSTNEDKEKISAIDNLFNYERGKSGNKLTTMNGVFLNAMAYLYDPETHINIVSLDKERAVIESLKITTNLDFDEDSYGKRIVLSNKTILEFFKQIGVKEHTSIIGQFLWYVLKEGIIDQNDTIASSITFALEKHLEEFLEDQWDNIEKFKQRKYEIYTKDGESVGIQFKAGDGRIDILARQKDTGNFVVIELKRNKTSDAVAGQILRYMNWVKDNLAEGKEVKGIIIAGDIDDNLRLSLADRTDIELMCYKIDFKLLD